MRFAHPFEVAQTDCRELGNQAKSKGPSEAGNRTSGPCTTEGRESGASVFTELVIPPSDAWRIETIDLRTGRRS
jgi:hypothetical protein